MEPKEQLAEVMKSTSLIALASSVEDLPNVRILDIFFDEKQNVVVFPTSALSPKVKEFEAGATFSFSRGIADHFVEREGGTWFDHVAIDGLSSETKILGAFVVIALGNGFVAADSLLIISGFDDGVLLGELVFAGLC